MRIRVLGSSAGGGLPQWNCGCANCRAARAGAPNVKPRTQSSIAVSHDGERWVICNVSPDVRTQLARYEDLAPAHGQLRGSPISAVVLTNADVDHAAGLLLLREGGAPPIYCTERVRHALTVGLSILPALDAYGQVEWRRLEPNAPTMIRNQVGDSVGVEVRAFPVASKPPPYMVPHLMNQPRDDLAGDTVGLLLFERHDGPIAAYVPGVRDLDPVLQASLARCAVILVDGTFYTDDELVSRGMSTKTARMMGHAPLVGDDGLIAFLGRFPNARRVLVHINNSNPILDESSVERAAVIGAGIEIAEDGLEIVL